MLNKIQPINNTLDYWHKYRPWAHKYLSNYTNDPDLHGNLDTDLWYLLLRILSNIKNPKTLSNYIKNSIRGIAKRIKNRLGYKYGKHDLLLEDILYDVGAPDKLNITIDEYLERQALLKYVNRLQSNQAIVIKKYFGIPPYKQTKLRELAIEMNLSNSRLHAIKEQGLRNLRKILNNKGIYNIKDFIYGQE